MDPARNAPARYLESKISALLARIPSRHRRSAFDPETLTLFRGITWWMASCILAWISLEATREMTLIEYRNSYSPPRGSWEAVLSARGFHPSPETAPGLPKGIFKVNSALDRILLPAADPREESFPGPARVWKKGKGGLSDWSERPFNLQGFEAWILELDVAPKTAKVAASGRGRQHPSAGNSIDPREIRY
jgi:hypothetical protein